MEYQYYQFQSTEGRMYYTVLSPEEIEEKAIIECISEAGLPVFLPRTMVDFDTIDTFF